MVRRTNRANNQNIGKSIGILYKDIKREIESKGLNNEPDITEDM